MATNESTTFGSKDYEIKSLVLINSNGGIIDIRKIFVEMQIFQDIYSSVMNGNILITDGGDLFSNFCFVGDEHLKIVIDKPGMNRPIEKTFRVYKASDRKIANDSGQMYILHFCSEELIFSEQNLISKAYKSAKIIDIIYDIMINECGFDPSRIYKLEDTLGEYNIVIPNYRPFEAIQWATNRAYNENKYCYFFFENTGGYNLISLQSLFKRPVYKKMRYELKNVDRDPAKNKDSIDYFEILNDFDMIRSVSNGSFASRMLGVDIYNQKYTTYEYDLKQAEANKALLNKYTPIESTSVFNSKNSFFRTYIDVKDTATEKDNGIEKWMIPRAMHMAMMNHFRIKVVVPGDVNLKAGDVVEYEFPMFMSAQKSGKELDKYRSGKYLVASINHKFRENSFESIVELVSDSFSERAFPTKDIKALKKPKPQSI